MCFLRKILQHKARKNYIKIKQDRLIRILEEQLPEHTLFPLDQYYFIPQHDYLKEVIEKTEVDKIKWIKDKFDCENHSLYFHSILALDYGINACGVVISYKSAHAFNVMLSHVDKNITTYIFEPQEDILLTPSQANKDRYFIEGEIILI